jgi:hypothetical protein
MPRFLHVVARAWVGKPRLGLGMPPSAKVASKLASVLSPPLSTPGSSDKRLEIAGYDRQRRPSSDHPASSATNPLITLLYGTARRRHGSSREADLQSLENLRAANIGTLA